MRRILAGLLIVLVCGLMVVKGQDTPPNLILIVDRDLSLTVYVASDEPVILSGLALRVVKDVRTFQTLKLEEGFDSLRLTQGVAVQGTCFVYVQSGTVPKLPNICSLPERVFRVEIARVDVFWYDFNTNRQRDIAIVANDNPTGDVCPASLVECRFSFTPPLPGFIFVPSNSDWTSVAKTFDGFEMVLVPSGCFMMGQGSAAHKQCFYRPFWIDSYEVSNQAYGSTGKYEVSKFPRESVTWREADSFCKRRGGRLPTEREWEYAARGPNSFIYPWGNEFDQAKATFGTLIPVQVGSKSEGQSWVGAMDMSGNVWEWTSSIYKEYPYNGNDGRENSDSTENRVIRGGSWIKTSLSEERLSSTYRRGLIPSLVDDSIGFRCARDFQPGDLAP